MRIAFVSYDFGEYCVQHANGLLAHGEVLLILPIEQFTPYRDDIDSAVELRTFSKPRLRQPIRQIRTIQWIMRQIRDFRPDVIHFQLGHLWFNFVLSKLRRRYPIVFTIHDPKHHPGDRGAQNTPQWVMELGFRQADRIIVHANQLKQTLIDDMEFSPDQIHVVPHIAIGERNARPQPADEELVMFFGRIWPYKGLEYLIRAQPLINREVKNATFLIAGVGEDLDRYRDMMVDPQRFTVHNRWISDDERADYFQRASVIVLPYVEASQSGVVPIAYAHSKPVVATRTGGLPDIVDDGRTGLLVEPADEIGLANAVISLLNNKALARTMGEAGNLKLKQELAPNVVCEQTAMVYKLAIAERAASKSRLAPDCLESMQASNR